MQDLANQQGGVAYQNWLGQLANQQGGMQQGQALIQSLLQSGINLS
jgi:hypothetical protein